jgi:hypothetical protein
MKVIGLTIVLAVSMLGLLSAAPAAAQQPTRLTLTGGCNGGHGLACINLAGTIPTGTDQRTIVVDLEAVGATGRSAGFEQVPINLPANHTGQAISFDSGQVCFHVLDLFPHLAIFWLSLTAPSGESADLVIVRKDGTSVDQRQLPAIIADSVQEPCPSSSPASAPRTQSAATPPPAAQALAQTGGMDLRLPILGVLAVAAGVGLLLAGDVRRRTSPRS